jgi:acyl carrier protein
LALESTTAAGSDLCLEQLMSSDEIPASSAAIKDSVPTDMRQARAVVKAMILRIAPDLDADQLDSVESLHDLGDFDSLDFVNLMSVATELTGIVVPPRDYPQMITIDSFAAYLLGHAALC